MPLVLIRQNRSRRQGGTRSAKRDALDTCSHRSHDTSGVHSPLNMTENQQVERIGRKLDKMVQKNNTDGALDLLRELKTIAMSLETLQSTRVGMSVNAVRKLSSDQEVQSLAKTLIKSWKKLIDGAGKSKSEKKDSSPPRKTSKDSSEESSTTAKCLDVVPSLVPSFPVIPLTTDHVRNKCRELLVGALQTADDYKTFGVDCSLLAAQIEEQIFEDFKSTDIKYKARLRSRISNLKDQKNPDLRRNVLSGNISTQRIASMTSEEMASEELKKIRETLTQESIREHQLSKVSGSKTDMFVCKKCRGKNCTYTQVQTRSADEPMTTYVVCNDCGKRWKVNASYYFCMHFTPYTRTSTYKCL
ncbi:transcription elongation factor A protein 2-like isoform X2 [Stigmatopora nigra]